jgi:hypothetical protein
MSTVEQSHIRENVTNQNTRETLRLDDSEKEDSDFKARLVGYTPEGAPILQFLNDPGHIRHDRGSVIGRGDEGVIVAFRKSMTAIIDGQYAEKPADSSLSEATTPQRPPPVVRIASPSPIPSRSPF